MSDTRMYSCDFDGLLCDDAWLEIGRPHMDTIDFFINLRACGKEQFSISHVVKDGKYCPNCGTDMREVKK